MDANRANKMVQVANPYLPEYYRHDLRAAQIAVERRRARNSVLFHPGHYAFMGLAKAALVTLLANAILVGILGSDFSLLAAAGMVLGFFTGYAIPDYVKDKRAIKQLESFGEQLPLTHVVHRRVEVPVSKLAADLALLSPESRAELRPLWDNVLESAEVLVEDPYNREAQARIWKRHTEAGKVLQAEKQFEAAALADRQKMLELEEAARRSSIVVSDDDSDLALASAKVAALEAGRVRYSELTDSLD